MELLGCANAPATVHQQAAAATADFDKFMEHGGEAAADDSDECL